MIVHFTDNYIINPAHKVTVNLIGLGGTGSQVLTCLAKLNETLVALDHPGIHVKAYDPDIVSEANIGRQLFSPADIGHFKSNVLVTRINRYFGYEWESHPEVFLSQDWANITITCIDTAAGRVAIANNFKYKGAPRVTERAFYWLDIGNLAKTGQAILGTMQKVDQPKSEKETTEKLPTVIEKFPAIKKIKEKDQGPSCSVAQAIKKQDLFINSTLANLGMNILWKLFREGVISVHGCYVNLDTMCVNPIRIEKSSNSKSIKNKTYGTKNL